MADAKDTPQLFPTPQVCSSPTFWTVARLVINLVMILVVTSNVLMMVVTGMCNLFGTNRGYITSVMLLNLFVFIATYCVFVRILFIALKQNARIAAEEQRFQGRPQHELFPLKASIRAAKSIMLALSLFTLCWGPYYLALLSFVLFSVQEDQGFAAAHDPVASLKIARWRQIRRHDEK
nr:hypothetical protein BaRGS_006638 [Batillaria attramentaria]